MAETATSGDMSAPCAHRGRGSTGAALPHAGFTLVGTQPPERGGDGRDGMRILLGGIAGAVCAVRCLFVLEYLGHQIHPPPAGIENASREEMARMIAQLPMSAFALVVAARFFGALIGAWVANAIAKRGLAGWIVALLV